MLVLNFGRVLVRHHRVVSKGARREFHIGYQGARFCSDPMSQNARCARDARSSVCARSSHWRSYRRCRIGKTSTSYSQGKRTEHLDAM
jgi:hypothetical protein